MNKSYLALTIGPIYKTFQNVRKTREVWAASYLFSYLMKQIVIELEKQGIALERFIVPFVNKQAIAYKGVGIFPDRIIFQSQNGDYEKLVSARNKAVKSFSEYYSDQFPGLYDYLVEYLRMPIVEKTLPAGANIIEEMFKHLNTLELQNIPLSPDDANCTVLLTIFNQINNKKPFFLENNFQKTDIEFEKLGLKDANGNVRFESVAEIATTELRWQDREKYQKLVNDYLWDKDKKIEKDTDVEKPNKDTDGTFIEELKKKFEQEFKPYHKYIAIVKADGDKVGSTIAGMNGDVKKIREFSEGLLNWAFASDKAVREYGGIPIYIGGDDLLLFAPIACKGKTLLDLIDSVDKTFEDAMKSFKGVSLSYGVSITYYKFPMFEALGKVDELLKQAKDYSEHRNAVCMHVLKHSGAVFETTFRKGAALNTKKLVRELMECISGLENKKDQKEKSFLNSVGYYLRDNEDLLKIIGADTTRLENFFANNFEDYQREADLKITDGQKEERKPKANYLKKVEELVAHSYQNEPNSERALASVYSIIRISRFLKGQEDDK